MYDEHLSIVDRQRISAWERRNKIRRLIMSNNQEKNVVDAWLSAHPRYAVLIGAAVVAALKILGLFDVIAAAINAATSQPAG